MLKANHTIFTAIIQKKNHFFRDNGFYNVNAIVTKLKKNSYLIPKSNNFN